MAIDIASSTLVSIFVESVLYGFFVFLFGVSSTIIFGRHKRQVGNGHSPNKILLVVSCTMFVLATIHIGTDVWRLLDAFVTHRNDPHGGTNAILGNVSTKAYLVKTTVYCMQTLVGDGFMIYRLYLVWNGNKLVCLPVMLTFIASFGISIGALLTFSRVPDNAPVFGHQLHDWIASFFSITLFTNFASTALIAGRIWWVQRQITGLTSTGKPGGRRGLAPAAIVIIESGAIYSACLILLLSLYLSGSFAQYVLLDAVQQVVGIVFSLVIVRVALGVSSDFSIATTNRSSHVVFHATRPSANTTTVAASEYELRQGNFVKVTKHTENDAKTDIESSF